jgi:hypothetical protein
LGQRWSQLCHRLIAIEFLFNLLTQHASD